MSRFEYDVIKLKAEHDANDRRCYRWQSKRGGCRDMNHDDLESMLNQLGAQGWRCVSHDTDAAFGSTLILMREVAEGAPDAAPMTGKRRTVVATDPKAVEAVEKATAEIQKMRADLAGARPDRTITLTDPALLAAITGVADRIERAPAPVATLDAEAKALLTDLASREIPAPIVNVSVDAHALAELDARITRALTEQRSIPAFLDPGSVRALEAAIERAQPQLPAVPAQATLSTEAIAAIRGALAEAVGGITLPVPAVQVHATIEPAQLEALRPTVSEATFARLEDAVRCALARPVTPVVAELSEGAEARLLAALQHLPVPRMDLSELSEAFSTAVARIPRPEVVALPTDLSPAALNALVTAMERVIAKIPTPAVSARLDEASVARLERAITSAVAAAIAPKEEPVPFIPEPKRAPIWSRIANRLGLAAS